LPWQLSRASLGKKDRDQTDKKQKIPQETNRAQASRYIEIKRRIKGLSITTDDKDKLLR
jgi:hypothetical protein